MIFNFGEDETTQSQIYKILTEYDMIVMDFPRQYEGCPLLRMDMIHQVLKISESWLSLGQKNVLLMHCECGGWPVLAFMLAALLIYRRSYTGEQKTLDMIYKQAHHELLQMLSPLNPMPSQLRYLNYVSRRNVGSEWPPLGRALTLDCIILRMLPNFNGEGGCRPIFRIYGHDPFIASDQTPKVLFSTPKMTKFLQLYKQVIAEKTPELLAFSKDLISLDIATEIQLKTLAEEMQAINKGLEKVEQEYSASENDGPVSITFNQNLKDFITFATGEVRSLTSPYSAGGRNADALARYFGEDPARCPFEQVVSTLSNFVRLFIRAHGENLKQIELEKKKAQQEAENEKAKTGSPKKEKENLSGQLLQVRLKSANSKNSKN